MKKLVLTLAVFSLTVLLHAQKSIDITYIANDGFLISGESKQILIDALFNNSFGEFEIPSEQLRTEITEGKPPFSKVDLYLVTHKHGDHFYAPYVIDFLKHHTETQFVSSGQVNESLVSASSIKKQLDSICEELGGRVDTTIQKIPLTIYRVRHLYDSSGTIAINMAYLITLNNFKILHIGDAPIDYNRSYYDQFHLENKNIDILFQGGSISDATKQFIQEVIKPKYIIAMHIPPKDMGTESKNFFSAYQNGIVFKTPMETKTFTK